MSALAPHIAAFRALAAAYRERARELNGKPLACAMWEEATVHERAADLLEYEQMAAYQAGTSAAVAP